MPRPRDNEPCAVCVETMQPRCCASDFNPGDTRTHLQFMWDLKRHKHRDMDDAQFEQWMIEYALNRHLAPFRDKRRKDAGEKAKVTVKSRNLAASNVLEKKCPILKGALRCMRNAGHEGEHRY